MWGGGALDKRAHLVNWKVMCIDKRQGGLGVRILSFLNRALLGKLLRIGFLIHLGIISFFPFLFSFLIRF